MPATEPGAHVRAFVREKGRQVLDVLGEHQAAHSQWEVHSHGAWRFVAHPHEDLFDRLVVILPRPERAKSDEFNAWADDRLKRIGKFMEATNSGRVVRTLPVERCFVAVLMRRTGGDPGSATTELPPPPAIPDLLKQFTEDVGLYIRIMADDDLRFVSALRLHRIPQKGEGLEFRLGLDALNTVIGLRSEALELAPATLVRGVLEEIVARLLSRVDELEATRSIIRPAAFVRLGHQAAQLRRLIDQLDSVVARIDDEQPDATAPIAQWLGAVRVPSVTGPLVATVVLAVLVVAGAAGAAVVAL